MSSYRGIIPSPGEINDIWVDMVRWLRQNMPEENDTEPVDLEQELRLALGDQTLGDNARGDEKISKDNDVLN